MELKPTAASPYLDLLALGQPAGRLQIDVMPSGAAGGLRQEQKRKAGSAGPER